MKLPAMVIVAGALFAPAAFAVEIPRYNPEAHCDETAALAGDSSRLRQFCIEQEQGAYNELRDGWGDLSKAAISHCDDIARIAGGSYRMLQFCIEREMDAEANMPEFQF